MYFLEPLVHFLFPYKAPSPSGPTWTPYSLDFLPAPAICLLNSLLSFLTSSLIFLKHYISGSLKYYMSSIFETLGDFIL